MQEQLSSLLAKATGELQAIRTRPELESAKARYVGPNGELTARDEADGRRSPRRSGRRSAGS